MAKKFKLFSKLKTNVIDHPKIKYSRLRKRKWLRLKNTVPQRLSEFGSLLMSKQMLRAFYGNCSEKEFTSTYKKAKTLKGNTGVNFIKLLEHRLDTVLFRMRFANTFEEIHQFITHKHIMVNDQVVHTSSFIVKTGDKISIRKDSFDFICKNILTSFEQYLNLEKVKITKNADRIMIVFTSRSFLQQQVRSMVGCLKYLGEEKWNLKKFNEVLVLKKRVNCAPPAPPMGLYLTKVEY